MSMPRSRLLARLFASEPRLVRLLAPAGYGKSSLARLFARRFDRHSICDCSNVTGTVDFAGRALSALAAESQSGGESISLTRLRLHATEADAATWSRALLEVWKSRQEHSLFILEHAEAIADNNAVLALLGDMLAARPAERVLLISSRIALPLRFSHSLAPHQLLTLSRSELRFDDAEAASAFESGALAPELVTRIVRLADGWPLVVLLLALFAQYDTNLEDLVARLEDVPQENVHDYLANEVITAFTPEMMSAMLAMAAIPNASLEDVAAATGIRHATPIIDRFLHLPGFVSSDTGVYHMHPLLRAALRAHHGADPGNYLIRAAREYERTGDVLRAAELYAFAGDEVASAAALDRLPASDLQAPSSRVIDALTAIEMPTLCTNPNIWMATLPYRRQSIETLRLYNEAHRLLRSTAPDASDALNRRLRVRLAILAQELEKLAEARTLIEACGPPRSQGEAPEDRRFALMTSALIAAKQGRFSEAEAFVDQSDAISGARHVRFEAERAQIAMERTRLLGDWHGVLKSSEEALYAAQRSGVTSRIVDAARAVASAAWYCDDDARVTAASEMLEDCGDTESRAFDRFVDAAPELAPGDAPAHVLAIARWHAAMATTDGKRAMELFDRAIDEIDTVENAFLRVVIRVCAALLLPIQRRRLLEARVIAQSIESPPLQASLELLIDSLEPTDYGIFKHLATRVSRSPIKLHRDVLHIDVARGQVRRGTQLLPVSDRGLELLAALALLPAGTAKEDVAGAIWPALDGEAALNTLKMCVSRTRAQLGDKEAISSTRRGYSLSEHVGVDVREFERLLRDVRGADTLGEQLRRQVDEAIAALAGRERSYAAAWPWFPTHAAHLDELLRELKLVLAKDAFKRGDAALPSVSADMRPAT
jgi:hypothetical protein